jgi:hypothetical protein
LFLVGHVDADALQHALDAAVAGDLDGLVAMLDPGLEWRGPEQGWWMWRRAPS